MATEEKIDEGVVSTTLYAPADLLEFYSLESVRQTGKCRRRNDLLIEALEAYREVLENQAEDEEG